MPKRKKLGEVPEPGGHASNKRKTSQWTVMCGRKPRRRPRLEEVEKERRTGIQTTPVTTTSAVTNSERGEKQITNKGKLE